jgi:hypothetical protein
MDFFSIIKSFRLQTSEKRTSSSTDKKMDTRLIALGEQIHEAMQETLDSGWGYDLGGGCAVGAYFLMAEAKRKLGLDVEFVCASNHAWNEYDGHIYDITATQFGVIEKVFVSPLDLSAPTIKSSQEYHYKSLTRRTLAYVNKEWPDYQSPNGYELTWVQPNKARVVRVSEG